MEGKGRRQERASYSFFPSSARDGGGPSRSWFAFFCVLVWFLMASVLFPLSAWPVLGNSGWEYQLRGGSCIVPITAVCGHIPTIKTQKEKKEEKKKPTTKSLSSLDPREDWEFAVWPNASWKAWKSFASHAAPHGWSAWCQPEAQGLWGKRLQWDFLSGWSLRAELRNQEQKW